MNPLPPSLQSPRLLIQTHHPEYSILRTEQGDGTPEPNSALWDDLREELEKIDDRPLAALFDPATPERQSLNKKDLAARLTTELKSLINKCLAHPDTRIQNLAREPMVDLDGDLANHLGIHPGRRSVRDLLWKLDQLLSNT